MMTMGNSDDENGEICLTENILGDLADFLGGELGGVCDDPERYAALEQFQRDFFHGVALATCLTTCLTACLTTGFTVFHCNF